MYRDGTFGLPGEAEGSSWTKVSLIKYYHGWCILYNFISVIVIIVISSSLSLSNLIMASWVMYNIISVIVIIVIIIIIIFIFIKSYHGQCIMCHCHQYHCDHRHLYLYQILSWVMYNFISAIVIIVIIISIFIFIFIYTVYRLMAWWFGSPVEWILSGGWVQSWSWSTFQNRLKCEILTITIWNNHHHFIQGLNRTHCQSAPIFWTKH